MVEKGKPRICIYCPYCYPIFNPRVKGHFGGWEVRVSLIAKELVKRGNFDVTIIVADAGQPHVEERDGVRLVSWVGKEFWKPSVYQNQTIVVAEAEAGTVGQPVGQQKTEQAQQQEPAWPQDPVPPSARRAFLSSMKKWLSKYISKKTLIIISYIVASLIQIARNFYQNSIDALSGILAMSKALIRLLYSAVKELVRTLYLVLKTALRPWFLAIRGLFTVVRQAVYMQLKLWDAVIGSGDPLLIWHKDISLLDEVDADIYLVPGNHAMSAVTATYCNKQNKKYIFLAGSDMDYYPEFKANPGGHDIYGEPYFLKIYSIEQATAHIVQTPRQAEMLQTGYGRSSVVIRNPIALLPDIPNRQNARHILWVGTSDERVKRPSMVFELARRLPEYPFVIIMKCLTGEDMLKNTHAAKALPNVNLKFDVPFAEVETYFNDARLFVNTSAFEGFPNTFLQASKYGVPIVSLNVDPGEMLSQHGCGFACGEDFDLFTESTSRLMGNKTLYSKTSASCLEYVRTFHDKEIIMDQYEEVFRKVLS